MFGATALRLKLYHQSSSLSAAPSVAHAGAPLGDHSDANAGTLTENFDSILNRTTTHLAGVPIFKWQTCMRSLVLVPENIPVLLDHRNFAGGRGEWLEEEAAYRRLLEIACGLHSPLVGETEVFGQFKDAIQARLEAIPENSSAPEIESAFTATLRHWSQALIEDVKLIRQNHLLNIGSQSYGSLVRREIRDFKKPQIDFLGSGQLAVEIVPWLLKAAIESRPFISVYARDVEKAQRRLEVLTTRAADSMPIAFRELRQGPMASSGENTARVLIVAAPLSAKEIAAWASDVVRYDLVVDLRGEGRLDSLEKSGLGSRIRSLDEIFMAIESAREAAAEKKTAALQLIEERAELRRSTAMHRPFGWDDVWS